MPRMRGVLCGTRHLLCRAQASSWARTREWDWSRDGGTWHWGHQAGPSEVLRVRRQMRVKSGTWFVGPGLLRLPRISFGGMKRVPSLPLSSRALCGASQFPKEAGWQLPLGSGGSRASNSPAVGNSTASHHRNCRLLWCAVPQVSCVPVWHCIWGEKSLAWSTVWSFVLF